jgi:hypothetical protein
MVMNTIGPATPSGGSGIVVSFGAGDSGGRLEARARGSARNANASSNEVRALRSRITRSGISAARRRALIREIDDNRRGNGSIRRGILADIAADFRDLA